MLNRFGFVITVIVFGALLAAIGWFAAGGSASLKTRAGPLGENNLAQGDLNPQPASADAQSSEKSSSNSAKNQYPKLEQLFLSLNNLSDTSAKFTLKLAQFSTEQNCSANAQYPLYQHLHTQCVAVQDQQERVWYVLTSGEYSSEAAQKAGYQLKVQYGLDTSIMRLPEKPKKA